MSHFLKLCKKCVKSERSEEPVSPRSLVREFARIYTVRT